MTATIPFHELVDAIENLPLDDQKMLFDIMQSRLAEQKQKEFDELVRQSREEYAAGLAKPTNIADLLAEIDR